MSFYHWVIRVLSIFWIWILYQIHVCNYIFLKYQLRFLFPDGIFWCAKFLFIWGSIYTFSWNMDEFWVSSCSSAPSFSCLSQKARFLLGPSLPSRGLYFCICSKLYLEAASLFLNTHTHIPLLYCTLSLNSNGLEKVFAFELKNIGYTRKYTP